MKKLFAMLAIAGVIISCNNKKEAKTETTDSDTTITTTPPVDNTTTTTNNTTSVDGVPTFADAEIQKFANDYTVFIRTYADAYKTKDMTKVTNMANDYQQWIGRTQSIGVKLANNPADAQKFNDYITKLTNELQVAM